MGLQACSSARRSGDPPGTYLWTQEDAGANNHITATPWNITATLWAIQYLQGGVKPVPFICDPENMGCLSMANSNPGRRHPPQGCRGTCSTRLVSLIFLRAKGDFVRLVFKG